MNVLVEKEYLEAIADAIRHRYGDEQTYTPAEMAPAILKIPNGFVDLQISSIVVTQPPNKVVYNSGDTFDPTGMIITAHYISEGIEVGTAEVSEYTVSPTQLTDGITEVVISYTENEITKTTKLSITVNKVLVDYIFTPPTKINYVYGDQLDFSGLKVEQVFSDGSTEDITSEVRISPKNQSYIHEIGTVSVMVDYGEIGLAGFKRWFFDIKVSKKTLPIPTQRDEENVFMYTGSSHGTILNEYQNSYPSNIVITGDRTAKDTGEYSFTMVPAANYMWEDGTEIPYTFYYSIIKTYSLLTVSNTTIVLNADNPSATLVLGGRGDGTIDTKYDTSAISVSIDGNNMTITKLSDAEAGDYTLTIQRLEGRNYTQSDSIDISITISAAEAWKWGNSGIQADKYAADQTWFDSLSENLATMTPSQRSELVGNGKVVDINGGLDFTVIGNGGTQTITSGVRVVGSDIDGEGTLTFSVEWVPNNAMLSSSGYETQLRTVCDDFYDNLPDWFKAHIVPVIKSRPNYPDQEWHVWPVSAEELGLTPAAGYEVGGDAYPYFTTNQTRKVYNGAGVNQKGYVLRNINGSSGPYITSSGTMSNGSPSSGQRFVRFMFAFK